MDLLEEYFTDDVEVEVIQDDLEENKLEDIIDEDSIILEESDENV